MWELCWIGNSGNDLWFKNIAITQKHPSFVLGAMLEDMLFSYSQYLEIADL